MHSWLFIRKFWLFSKVASVFWQQLNNAGDMLVFRRLNRLSTKRLQISKILSLKLIMPSELVKPQSLKSDTRLFKWAVIGVFVAGASYLALRRYRVVYCEENGCDPRDPLDLFVDQIRSKIDLDLSDLQSDLKSKLDTFGSEFWDTVQDKIMDAKMKEALDFILAILENLKEFDMPNIEYNVPRLILLFLVKRTQEYKVTKSSLEDQIPVKLSHIEFEESKRIGQFALNVYGATWAWKGDEVKVAEKMGMGINDKVLMTWFQDQDGDDFCPKFMIFTDEATKSIVLAIRGTFSLADVIVDVICDEEKYLDGYAHRGILKGSQKIMKESQETLKAAFQTHPDHKLVITGHSLGAGTAVLITMGILKNLYSVVPKGTKIQCLALAPPPVYRARKSPKIFKDNIDIFINGNDVVPRLSLANMAKLLAMLRAFDKVDLNIQDYLKILAGIEEPEVTDNLEKFSQILDGVEQDKFPNMQHHGRIFYLRRLQEGHFKIYDTPGNFFSDSLLLFENMISDHLQPYYEEAFSKVKLD